MSVRDRLRRLTGESSEPEKPQAEREAKVGELRQRIEEILERRPQSAQRPAATSRPSPEYAPVGIEEVATGREHDTPYGTVFVAEGEVDAGVFWGRRRLREFGAINMHAAAKLARDERLIDAAPTDALFLDTETTGLAGGTGTLAFLIGVGWHEGGRFVTRLIFARDFTEEAAALSVLSRYVEAKRFLVTFNGRTFDAPLLAARFVLNRLPDPLVGMPHLDLLPAARRLVGHRLENSRLVTLEAEVLGLRRDGDIPGAEIPQRYFDFLRSRDARLVADILEHNRLDVVSMAALTAHLAELLDRGLQAEDVEPADVVAAARLHLARGDAATAEALLRELVRECEAEACGAGGRELSLICKRGARLAEAAAIWERMLEVEPRDRFAAVEMAKWLEHSQKRFSEAILVVRRVLDDPALTDSDAREQLAHRLRRLERKAEKQTD
jgi:uncharacterized protein